MDSQPQSGKTVAVVNRDLRSDRAPLHRIGYERCSSALSKPADRLSSGREPCTPGAQVLDQVTITSAPQSLWRKTAIMPINRERAAKTNHVIAQLTQPHFCLIQRKIEIARIEHRCVH